MPTHGLRIHKALSKSLKFEDLEDSQYIHESFEKQLNQIFELLKKQGWYVIQMLQKQQNSLNLNSGGKDLDEAHASYTQVKAFTFVESNSATHDLEISEVLFEYSLKEEILNICFNLSNDFFLPKRERYERIAIENIDSLVMILSFFNNKSRSYNFYLEKEKIQSEVKIQRGAQAQEEEEEEQAEAKFRAAVPFIQGMNLARSVIPLLDEGMMIKNVLRLEDIWDRDFQNPLAFGKEIWKKVKEENEKLRSTELYLKLRESQM